MKFKVILYCVLIYCSQIVVSLPFAEEAIRHRAQQTGNWPVGHNGPEQYHGANAARYQNVNFGFKQPNHQEYYTHPGRNFDYTLYNHATPRTIGDVRRDVFDSGPEGRPNQLGLPNRRPHNLFESVIATATAAPGPVEERPLVTSVREPYRAPGHNAHQGEIYFPPGKPQYHHADGNQPFPVAREPFRGREQYRERRPFREQGLPRETFREPFREREPVRERNQFHNPIVENSENIRHFDHTPPPFRFKRPGFIEPEAFAVAAATKNVPINDHAPRPVFPPHHNVVPIQHDGNDNVENPHMQNVLPPNNKRFVIIHPNGTVDYLDKLDRNIQNNRNYHVVYSGPAGGIEPVNGHNGPFPQSLVPPTDNWVAPPPPIDTHIQASIHDKIDHGFPINPIIPDYVTTPSPFNAGYDGYPGPFVPIDHSNYVTTPSPFHSGYVGSPVPLVSIDHSDVTPFPPFKDVGWKSSINDNDPNKPLEPTDLWDLFTHPDHVTSPSTTAHPVDPDFKAILNKVFPVHTDSTARPDDVTTPSSISFDKHVEQGDNFPFVPLIPIQYHDFEITTQAAPQYTETPQPHDVTTLDNNFTKDDIITISPIELSTDNVSDAPPMQKLIELNKNATDVVSPANDKKDSIKITKTTKDDDFDKSDKYPDKKKNNLHDRLNVTQGNDIDTTTVVASDTLDIVTDGYEQTHTPFLSINKTFLISDNDSYVDAVTHSYDREPSLITTTAIPDTTVDDHGPVNQDNDYKNKLGLVDSLDISITDKNQEHHTTSAPDHFEPPIESNSDKHVLTTFFENIINITQPTNQKVINQTIDDNPTTATYNYTVHTDVPEITDDWLSVTTSSPIQSDINPVDTTDLPGDNELDAKSTNDVMVKFSIPADDNGETINIAIEVPTQDTENTDGGSDGDDTLVLSIDTKSGHDDDNVKKLPIDVTHTAVIQTSDGVDQNSMIDLTKMEDPVVWFRTTDSDFFEKLTKNKACDIVYLFQMKPQPLVEKDTKTTYYLNGTVVEDITETIYKNKQDPSPKIIKTSRIIHLDDSHSK